MLIEMMHFTEAINFCCILQSARATKTKSKHLFQRTGPGSGCSCTNLTPVIMGALFDLRRAPPPTLPAAPAHWSTSIRSIPLVGRPGRGDTCCRPPVA